MSAAPAHLRSAVRLALLWAVGSVATAGAQDADTVVVTGEVYAFGAQKVVSVTADDLEQTQAVDLHDVFSRDPSIQVGGGLAPAEKIYIRGIEDKLLHITIDGAPQGGYLSHHHGQYLIEPELLKRVQVEPGPGGATQGPGALAGSIRFETKDPADFLREGQNFGVLAKAGYFANAGSERLTTALYGNVTDDISVLGAFTGLETDNYEDGNGNEVDYTAHEQRSGFAKVVGTLADGQQLSLGVERLDDEGLYRHRPNFVGFFTHPIAPNIPVAMDLERTTVTLGYEQSQQGDGIAANAHYTNTTFSREAQYEMGYQSAGVAASDQRSFGAHTLRYGADFRDDEMSFTGRGSITGFARTLVYRSIPDETVQIAGLYLQDDWRALDRLEVAVGTRVDHYRYEDKDGQEYEDTGVSPTVGASYQIARGLQVNASYGRAFRGVTVIDAITANEGGIRNAAEIDPERAQNIEVGFQYSLGALYFSGTVYQQEIDDVIVDANNDTVRGNEGALEVRGYDLTAAYNPGALMVSLAVSESDPELNDANLVDTHFGLGAPTGRAWNGYLGYAFEALRLNVGWTTTYVEDYDDTPAGIPGKPSYVVHGAHAQWLPFEDGRLAATLVAQNVLDKFYVDQATSGYNSQLRRVAGLPEAGRDLRLSLAYRF